MVPSELRALDLLLSANGHVTGGACTELTNAVREEGDELVHGAKKLGKLENVIDCGVGGVVDDVAGDAKSGLRVKLHCDAAFGGDWTAIDSLLDMDGSADGRNGSIEVGDSHWSVVTVLSSKAEKRCTI